MALLLTYKKQNLFNVMVVKSNHLAQTLDNTNIQLSDEDYGLVKTFFCDAGRRVLKKMGPHTENIQIPYIITKEGENFPEADSINFTLATHENSRDGVIVPLLDGSVKEFIVAYCFNEWLNLKGVQPVEDVEDKLREIKRSLEYGTKTKRKYRPY